MLAVSDHACQDWPAGQVTLGTPCCSQVSLQSEPISEDIFKCLLLDGFWLEVHKDNKQVIKKHLTLTLFNVLPV